MLTFLLNLGLKLLTSEATKTLIAIGVNKLVQHKTDGVTSDIAKVMIEGIAKSKANPTKEDVFNDALGILTSKDN